MLDKTRNDDKRLGLTDPVCGMQVGVDSEHRHTYEGREYLFCSAACHDKFVAAPRQYLHPEPAGIGSGYRYNRVLSGRYLRHRLGVLHLPHAPGNPPERTRMLPEVRHDSGTGIRTGTDHPHGIYLPDASGDRAG